MKLNRWNTSGPVKSFTEIHIEQGKVLEHEQKRIGIVTGIAAPERFYVPFVVMLIIAVLHR